MSDFVQILDDVVTYVNAQVYSQTVNSARKYLPKNKVEELTDLEVVVFPLSSVEELDTRDTTKTTYDIGVAVSKLIDPQNSETIDELIVLTREILVSLHDSKFGVEKMSIIEIENDPIYDYEKLSQNNLFQSVIRLSGWVYD